MKDMAARLMFGLIVPILAGCAAGPSPSRTLPGTDDLVCSGPYRSARPLAVLLERSFINLHWESSIPKLALYADGRVLFARCEGEGPCSYFEAVLSKDEFARVRSELAPSDAFLNLKRRYSLISNVTDMPTVDILLANGERLHRVSVYGLFYEGATAAAYYVSGPPGGPDSLPGEFARYQRLMHELAPADAHPWAPAYLQVFFDPADRYALTDEDLARPPMGWPRWWPEPPGDAATRLEAGTFDIFVPASREVDLERLGRSEAEARFFGVALDGRRWLFTSGFPVVPGACEWSESTGD